MILNYNVVNREPVANGSFDYEVNFTEQAFLEGVSSANSSSLIWYLPNGTAAAVYYQNHNYTGLFALTMSTQYEVLFLTTLGLADNITQIAPFQVGSPVEQTIGSVPMNITTYDLTFPANFTLTTTNTTTTTNNSSTTTSSSTNSTQTSNDITVKVGTIASNGRIVASLTVYYYIPEFVTFQVTNLTRAAYS